MPNTNPYNEIKSENVLTRSGISRGPLYHHFSNFDDLIETAQSQIFLKSVTTLVAELTQVIESSSDSELVREEVRNLVAKSSMNPSLQQLTQRIGIIHNASSLNSLHHQLGETQEKLTKEWMAVYQLCVDKGWADSNIDARAVAILMQSTFIGRILDNLSSLHMKPDNWVQVLLRLFDSYFFCTALASRTQS